MFGYAIGDMKLPIREFQTMLLWQFMAAKEHHERAKIESWRQTRMIIHTFASVMGGKKSVSPDLTKFLPLPFDEDLGDKRSERERERDNLLVIEKFKRMGYLKPLEDGAAGRAEDSN